MFSRFYSDLVALCTNVADLRSTESVYLISAVANVAVGVSGMLRYLTPYLVDEYISQYVPRFDVREFVMTSLGLALTVMVGLEERGTSYNE